MKCCRKFIIIFLILFVACEEEGYKPPPICTIEDPEPAGEIWIDERCNDRVTKFIFAATDTVNDFGNRHMCRDLVKISGFTADFEGISTIQCRPEDSPDDAVARTVGGNIILYSPILKNMTDDYVEGTILHEYTHWIGVHGHIDEPAVMHPWAYGDVTDYTEADREFICQQLECLQF